MLTVNVYTIFFWQNASLEKYSRTFQNKTISVLLREVPCRQWKNEVKIWSRLSHQKIEAMGLLVYETDK